jgi:sugar-phosphatase
MTGRLLVEAAAVLFDNDGVLVRSHPQTEEAWTTLAAEFDIELGRLLTEGMGVRAEDTLARLVEPERVDAAIERLADLEVGLAPLTEAMPGADRLLRALPSDRWTVVTSACRRLAEARWRGAGLPLPDRSVTAEDVLRGKPNPEPFLTGAERLGVDPTDCVVFEDSPSGGLAAMEAGARVVAVGRQRWPDEVKPLARVDDLTGLVAAAGAGAGDDGLTLRLA